MILTTFSCYGRDTGDAIHISSCRASRLYLLKEAGDNRRAKVNTAFAGHMSVIPGSLDGVLIKHGRGVSQTAIKPTKAIWTSRKLRAYSICCRRLSLPGVAEVAAGRSLCSAAEPDQFRPSLKTHLVLVDPVKRSGLPTGWFICVRVCNIVAL